MNKRLPGLQRGLSIFFNSQPSVELEAGPTAQEAVSPGAF